MAPERPRRRPLGGLLTAFYGESSPQGDLSLDPQPGSRACLRSYSLLRLYRLRRLYRVSRLRHRALWPVLGPLLRGEALRRSPEQPRWHPMRRAARVLRHRRRLRESLDGLGHRSRHEAWLQLVFPKPVVERTVHLTHCQGYDRRQSCRFLGSHLLPHGLMNQLRVVPGSYAAVSAHLLQGLEVLGLLFACHRVVVKLDVSRGALSQFGCHVGRCGHVTSDEERIQLYAVGGGPEGSDLQHGGNEIFGFLRDILRFFGGPFVVSLPRSAVDLVRRGGLERRLGGKHGEAVCLLISNGARTGWSPGRCSANLHNDPQAPDVHHMVMASLPFLQDLGGYVVWSTTERRSANRLHVLARHQQGGQAKVPDLGVHMLVQEDVAHLEVAVDHALGVHVLDGACNLDGIVPDLGLRHTASPLDHIHERPIRAQF